MRQISMEAYGYAHQGQKVHYKTDCDIQRRNPDEEYLRYRKHKSHRWGNHCQESVLALPFYRSGGAYNVDVGKRMHDRAGIGRVNGWQRCSLDFWNLVNNSFHGSNLLTTEVVSGSSCPNRVFANHG